MFFGLLTLAGKWSPQAVISRWVQYWPINIILSRAVIIQSWEWGSTWPSAWHHNQHYWQMLLCRTVAWCSRWLRSRQRQRQSSNLLSKHRRRITTMLLTLAVLHKRHRRCLTPWMVVSYELLISCFSIVNTSLTSLGPTTVTLYSVVMLMFLF